MPTECPECKQGRMHLSLPSDSNGLRWICDTCGYDRPELTSDWDHMEYSKEMFEAVRMHLEEIAR